jgi:hypothetical protein
MNFASAGNRGNASKRAWHFGQCQICRISLSSRYSDFSGAISSLLHRTQLAPNIESGSNSFGTIGLPVCGAFAEFERSMIRQRVNAGLKRAVEQGKQPAIEKRILSHLRAGKGILKVARECGVVQRIAREMRGERPFEGVDVAA